MRLAPAILTLLAMAIVTIRSLGIEGTVALLVGISLASGIIYGVAECIVSQSKRKT